MEKEINWKTQDWSKVALNWDEYAKIRSDKKKEEQEELVRKNEIINEEGEPLVKYVWSDLDPQFEYTSADIPVPDLMGKISLKIMRYRALDRWVGQVRSFGLRYLQRQLSKSLFIYCEGLPSDPTPKCKVGQICFVKLPKYEEIDEMMEAAVGKSTWDKRRRPEMRIPDEDRHAGLWVRAECDAISDCKQYGQFTSIDTGRCFPARWTNARRAVHRFLTTPATAFPCILVLAKPVQITYAVHEKWYNIMKRGSHMTFKVLGITSEETLILRLTKPTEDEIDIRYKESLNGKPDPTEDSTSGLYNPPSDVYNRRGTFF